MNACKTVPAVVRHLLTQAEYHEARTANNWIWKQNKW